MKLRLTIESGSLAGQQFELEQGSLVLGRGPECNIRFDFKLDPGVSSRHALVRKDENAFHLIDERSTNGTLLNDQVVKESVLHNGDSFRLGPQGPVIRASIEEERPAVERTQQFRPPDVEPKTTPQPIPEPPPPGTAAPPPSSMGSLKNTFTSLASAYHPAQSKEGRRNLIGCIAAVIVCGFLMLVIMSIMIWQLGFAAAFVGSIMAFLPAPFYLFVVMWIDRYDPEPGWAIASAFAWGGLVAILVSFVMNTLFGTAMGNIAGAQGNTLASIISAPIFEEGSKGLGVVLLMLLLRREFDGVVDGIFYACVVALGFATFENVLYYGGQFRDGGLGGMLSNVFDRGLLAPFSHALFTSMTGLGCGISRETHNKMVRLIAPAAGYVLAMILHGFWNAIASAVGGVGYYIAYIMVWVPLFLIFLGGLVAVVRREQGIIKKMLVLPVSQNLITQEQFSMSTSLIRRTSWLVQGANDLKRFNARRKFLRAVTKLAFGYWHVEVAAKEDGRTISNALVAKYQSQVKELQSQI